MRRLLFASLFFPLSAIAQTPRTIKFTTRPLTQPKTLTAPEANRTTSISTPTPAPPQAPPPTNWKLSYYGEYQGPPLSYIDLSKTQPPNQPLAYAEWDHSLKFGYAVSKSIILGTQFRAASPLDPQASFQFADQRFYVQWGHFVKTSDVDIMGRFVTEIPTTDSSRNKGKIVAFKFETNVEFMTSLRNWSFSFATLIKPTFYNDPVSGGGKTDLNFGIFPYITVDLYPNTKLLFEGSFDGAHNYNAALYDYQSGDPDYVDIGPLFTINSHISSNLALRFFVDNISLKNAALYANIGMAL